MPRYNQARRCWEIDAHVTLPNGKTVRLRRKSPISTKTAAREYEQQAIKDLLADHAAGRKGRAPKFAAFVDEYLRHAAAENRASTYLAAQQICRDHLCPALGRLPLDEIDEEQIDRLRASLLLARSAQTARNVLSILRRILSLAVEWGRLARAPKVRMPRVPPADFDHLSIEETAQLLAGAREATPEWADLFLLAARTGMRAGELRGLQWADVDLGSHRLTVRRSVVGDRVQPPKGGRVRHLSLPADAVEMLRARRKGAGRGLWVFTFAGDPVSLSAIGRALRRACQAAGVREVHPHVLRHSYASQMVALGVPLRVVQQLLGHSSITTTERYAHLSPGAEAAAVARLEAAIQAAPTGTSTVEHKRNKASDGEGGQ